MREPIKPAGSIEPAGPAPIHAPASAWSPLRNGLFRNLWIATIVSNIGGWMHDVVPAG
jgi:hypothetical protein